MYNECVKDNHFSCVAGRNTNSCQHQIILPSYEGIRNQQTTVFNSKPVTKVCSGFELPQKQEQFKRRSERLVDTYGGLSNSNLRQIYLNPHDQNLRKEHNCIYRKKLYHLSNKGRGNKQTEERINQFKVNLSQSNIIENNNSTKVTQKDRQTQILQLDNLRNTSNSNSFKCVSGSLPTYLSANIERSPELHFAAPINFGTAVQDENRSIGRNLSSSLLLEAKLRRRSASLLSRRDVENPKRYVTEIKLNLKKDRCKKRIRNRYSSVNEQDSSSEGSTIGLEDSVHVEAVLCRAKREEIPGVHCLPVLESNKSSKHYSNDFPKNVAPLPATRRTLFQEPLSARSTSNTNLEQLSDSSNLTVSDGQECCSGSQNLSCAFKRDTNSSGFRHSRTPTWNDGLSVFHQQDKNDDQVIRNAPIVPKTEHVTSKIPRIVDSMSLLGKPQTQSPQPVQMEVRTILNTTSVDSFSLNDGLSEAEVGLSEKYAELNSLVNHLALPKLDILPQNDNEYRDRSGTSACTFMCSHVADDNSLKTLALQISSATVVSPKIGKTSRGTQSEQLQEAKILCDMQIQTELLGWENDERNKHCNSQNIVTPLFECGRSPEEKINIDNHISRLPIPKADWKFVDVDWLETSDLSEANKSLRYSTIRDQRNYTDRVTDEVDALTSRLTGSPSSFVVLAGEDQPLGHKDNQTTKFVTVCGGDQNSPQHTMVKQSAEMFNRGNSKIDSLNQNTMYNAVRENIYSARSRNPTDNVYSSWSLLPTRPKGTVCNSRVNQDIIKQEGNGDITEHSTNTTSDSARNNDGFVTMLANQPLLQTHQTANSFSSEDKKRPMRRSRDDIVIVEDTPTPTVWNKSNDAINACEKGAMQNGPQIMLMRRNTVIGDAYSQLPRYLTTEKRGFSEVSDRCMCPTTASETCTENDTGTECQCLRPHKVTRDCSYDSGSRRSLRHQVKIEQHSLSTSTSSSCSTCTKTDDTTSNESVNLRHRISKEAAVYRPYPSERRFSQNDLRVQQPWSQPNKPETTRITNQIMWISPDLESTQTSVEQLPRKQRQSLSTANQCAKSDPQKLMSGSSQFVVTGLDEDNEEGKSVPETDDAQLGFIDTPHLNNQAVRRQRAVIPQKLVNEREQPDDPAFQVQQKPTTPERNLKFMQPPDREPQNLNVSQVDRLFNMVGDKEKCSILQRWLLEQVAYSTKKTQMSVNKRISVQNRLDQQQENQEYTVQAEGTDSGDNDSELVCSCSECRAELDKQDSEYMIECSNDILKLNEISRSVISLEPHELIEQNNTKRMDPVSKSFGSKTSRMQIISASNPAGNIEVLNEKRPASTKALESQHINEAVRQNARRNSECVQSPWEDQSFETSAKQRRKLRSASHTMPEGDHYITERSDAAHKKTAGNELNVTPKFIIKRDLNEKHLVSRERLKNSSDAKLPPTGVSRDQTSFTHASYRMNEQNKVNQKLSRTTSAADKFPPRSNGQISFKSTPVQATHKIQSSLSRIKPKVSPQSNFNLEHTYELSPYDDLIKSHLNATDRRIKSVATKNGCEIRIVGPISTSEPSTISSGTLGGGVGGASTRSKISYRCHVAGPSIERIGKCVNFLKETFPNSFLRTSWRA